MNTDNHRSEPRKKSCVQAFASNLEDSFDIKCIIRDVSKSGCMIVSSQVNDLPELIHLVPEHFDKPLNGKIVWRKDKMAGVVFLSPHDEENLSNLRESIADVADETDADEREPLEASIRPLGYAGRLARYNPRSG